MESMTKRRLTPEELDALARRATGAGIVTSAELTDGFANAVWRLSLDDGREVVLKLSPPPELEQLTYERDLLRMEARAYELAGAAGVPLADLVAAGFDDPVLGGDYLVLSALTGTSWNQVELPAETQAALRRELGGHMARFNSVRGDVYGYPHSGITGATWREAFLAMVEALLKDTERYPTELPVPEAEIRDRVHRAAPALDAVTEPRLVHFDIWPGNAFVDLSGGTPRIQAVIDLERAFWGDPLAELITPTIFAEVDPADPFLAGYREIAPLDLDPVRLDLYRAYLYLILLVENGPRQYPPEEYAPLRDAASKGLTRALARL
ncbi:phosphotransferase family protein [Nonomuraea sp. NPDC050663]|uniref:phosphotransferase family protein n=1 Tax=Nonomuraea sp. NPDC050663 TaxID=3364370 RepID=UPI0037AC8458